MHAYNCLPKIIINNTYIGILLNEFNLNLCELNTFLGIFCSILQASSVNYSLLIIKRINY